MKRKFKIIAFSFLGVITLGIFVAAISDGWGRPSYRSLHGIFDIDQNLYFHTVHDTFVGTKARGKEYKYTRPVDVAIYHQNKDSVSYLFNHKRDEQIQNVLFESRYSDKEQRMVFMSMTHNYYFLQNVDGVADRKPSENMIILTRNPTTNVTSIWRAHKTGKNLKRLKQITSREEFMIDVLNQQVLIIGERPREMKVWNYSY